MTTLTPNGTIPTIYTSRINLIKGNLTMARIELYVNSVTGMDFGIGRGGVLGPYKTFERCMQDVFELLALRQMVRVHLAGSKPHILSPGYVFPQIMSPDEITLDPTQAFGLRQQAPLVIQGTPTLLDTIPGADVVSQVNDPTSGLLTLTTTHVFGLNFLKGKWLSDANGVVAAIASNTFTALKVCYNSTLTAPIEILDSNGTMIVPIDPLQLTPTINLRGSTAPIVFQGVRVIAASGGAVGVAQGTSALFVGCDIPDISFADALDGVSNASAAQLSGCAVGDVSGARGSAVLHNAYQSGNFSAFTHQFSLEGVASIFDQCGPVGYNPLSGSSAGTITLTECEVLDAPSHGIRASGSAIVITNVLVTDAVGYALIVENAAAGTVENLGGSGNGGGVNAMKGAVLGVGDSVAVNNADVNPLVVGANPAMTWTDFFAGDAPHSSRDLAHGASVYREAEVNQNAAAPRHPGRDVAGSTTVLPSDEGLLCSTTGAPSAVTLPKLALSRGRVYVFTKVDAAVDAVVLTPFPGDTIGGSLTVSLLSQYDSIAISAPPSGSDWTVESGVGSTVTASLNFDEAGVFKGTRPELNFASGATVTDNPGMNRVDVDVVTLLKVDEAGVLKGTRPELNFVSGATVVDNPGMNRVDVTITGGGSGSADVQVFSLSGVYPWVKPVGAKSVWVKVIGSGGGGGSGRRGAALSNRAGGGGGGGGGWSERWFRAASLPALVSITVGAGGLGGGRQTVDNSNGISAGAGNFSFFGTLLRARGGGSGNGGTLGTGAFGNGGTGWTAPGGFGGAGNNNANGSTGSVNAGLIGGPRGGGGGGGIDLANSLFSGGNGGEYTTTEILAGPLGGVAPNGSGGNAISVAFDTSTGGAGGGATNNSVGGNGGNGSEGSGGGGGGASPNGNSSGKGGDGGDGYVIVITYF